MEHTFGLGGGGEKLTWGLLITPSDMDAVAKAKCLLLLPQPPPCDDWLLHRLNLEGVRRTATALLWLLLCQRVILVS